MKTFVPASSVIVSGKAAPKPKKQKKSAPNAAPRSGTPATLGPQVDVTDPPVAAAPPAALRMVLQSNVQDRWTRISIQHLTPQVIENILRDAFSGNLVSQWQLFDLMEDTWPRLRKDLNELKRAAIKVDYTPMPFNDEGKKPSARALQKSWFLKRVMGSTRPDVTKNEASFHGCLMSILDAVAKGISIQEILWETRTNRGQLEIAPRGFNWIHPRYYGYPMISAQSDQLLMSRNGMTAPNEVFPPDQFLISIFKTKEGHPIGGALLRCLATLWLGSNFAFDWALNLAQIFGLPIRWATYDPTKPGLLQDICDMLENMGSAGWAAFPTGTTFELKEAVKNAGENPQSVILKIADTACDLLILGQTETSSSGDTGSRAKAQVHFDVRADVIEFVARWATDILNTQLVPALMRFNFGDNDEDPVLVAEVELPKDALAMAQRDQILVGGLGLKVGKQWFYERHDIPQPGPLDEVLELQPAPGGGGAPDPTPTVQEDNVDAKLRIIRARTMVDPQERLAANVAEQLTGVTEKALAPVMTVFKDLVSKARSSKLTDEELVSSIQKAANSMPELFPNVLRSSANLRDLLEAGMGASMVNGALRVPVVKGKN